MPAELIKLEQAMAKKKSLCRTSTGSYVRNLGWKVAGGKYVQHKFHLGPDESSALLAGC